MGPQQNIAIPFCRVATRCCKKIDDMYNRFDGILACDRQTGGQTSCHRIVRAMHMRHAVTKLSEMESHYRRPWQEVIYVLNYLKNDLYANSSNIFGPVDVTTDSRRVQ